MKQLYDILPIKTERCLVRNIEKKDIDWYITTINRPFFNEFMDVKASEISSVEIIKKLYSLVEAYKEGNIKNKEVRMVIEVDGELVGGVTIFEPDVSIVSSLGYWVIPEMQRKGIAYEVINSITTEAYKRFKGNKLISLIIREDNEKSIKLAEKMGYRYISNRQGVEKTNRVYMYTDWGTENNVYR